MGEITMSIARIRNALLGAGVLILGLQSPTASAQFIESGGVVSMEAENADQTHNWNVVPGMSGSAMVDVATVDHQGWLRFNVRFCQAGDYTVWFIHQQPEDATDGSNDCFIDLDGDPMWSYGFESDSACRPIGMGTHQKSLGWQSRPKTNTCEDARKEAVYIKVAAAGNYTFSIESRAAGYTVDKIVLIKDGRYARPTGKGPAETIGTTCGATIDEGGGLSP
jgi:hypothetical protein